MRESAAQAVKRVFREEGTLSNGNVNLVYPPTGEFKLVLDDLNYYLQVRDTWGGDPVHEIEGGDHIVIRSPDLMRYLWGMWWVQLGEEEWFALMPGMSLVRQEADYEQVLSDLAYEITWLHASIEAAQNGLFDLKERVERLLMEEQSRE